MPPTLYHYTCADHGRLGIGNVGNLYAPVHLGAVMPAGAPRWARRMLELVWMTDLEVPVRHALGLTSRSLYCDRTEWRYIVTDTTGVQRYLDIRRDLPRALRDGLEAAPGVMPAHWWVSELPVPVKAAPVGALI